MDVGDTSLLSCCSRHRRAHSVTLLARCRSAHPAASLNLLRYAASVSRLSSPLPCFSSSHFPIPSISVNPLSRPFLAILPIYFVHGAWAAHLTTVLLVFVRVAATNLPTVDFCTNLINFILTMQKLNHENLSMRLQLECMHSILHDTFCNIFF